MVNSTESSATVFDGLKNEAMDDLRVRLDALKEFLGETVTAWGAMASQPRTKENYSARDKLVDDIATIVSKTDLISVESVKAAAGTPSQKTTTKRMTALRAKTYKAVKGMPPLCEPEEDEEAPSEDTIETWRELVETLTPGADWIKGGGDIPLGGDAAAAAVNQAVDDANKKPPKGAMSAALSAAANGVTNLFSPARHTRSSGVPPTSTELPKRRSKQSTPAEGKGSPPELNLTSIEKWTEKAAAAADEPPQTSDDVKDGEDAVDDIEEAVRKEEEKLAAEEEKTKEVLAKVAAAEKRVEELRKQREKEQKEEKEEQEKAAMKEEAAKKKQEEKEREAERKVEEKGEERKRLTEALKKLEKEEQEAKEEQRQVKEEGKKKLQAAERKWRQEAEKTAMANRRLQQLADQEAALKNSSEK